MAQNIGDPTAVTDSDLCIGCGVCALAFPELVTVGPGPSGFQEARLKQDAELSPDQSASFRSFCPGLGYSRPARGVSRESSAMWGTIIAAREAWASTPETRRAGSSGGAITAIAGYLLASDKVDAVVGIRGSADPLSNEAQVIRSVDQCASLGGSRYSPATPFARLGDLGRDERIAVVGKPCDVAGLRQFLNNAVATHHPNVVAYLSFFCAGTPSWQGTRDVVDKLQVPISEVQTLRYRGNGWPGQFTVTLKDGTQREMPYEDSWGRVLNKHLHTRCKMCQDGVGAQADIVAADAWQADDRGYPVFTESDGRSLLITRTPVGEALVDASIEAGFLTGAETDIGGLGKTQPSQRIRREVAAARTLGYKLGGHAVPRWHRIPRWRWILKHPAMSMRQFIGAYRRARSKKRSAI